MCLYVDRSKHPELEPLVAEEDILVVKALRCVTTGDGKEYFSTPYRNVKIGFEDGYSHTMREPDLGVDMYTELHGTVINTGLHSFSLEYFTRHFVGTNYGYIQYYYAVIPKGSHYYIGLENDLVSDKLVVYKYVPEDVMKNAIKSE